MPFAFTLILTLILVLLGGIAVLGLAVRLLTRESAAERAMRVDSLTARPPTPLSVGMLDIFFRWRGGANQLTYRRDSAGRFRKVRR